MQYERLFKSRKWDVAVENIFIYGFVFTVGCLIIGFISGFNRSKDKEEKVFLERYFYTPTRCRLLLLV